MVDPVLLQQVVELSPDDRRELLEAVQDTVDPGLAAMIDERERATTADPHATRVWNDFRAELRDQYGR